MIHFLHGVGNVPDWNFERANFDRVQSEDQFEQISMKAVYRVVTSSSEVPTTAEKQNGARFLLNGASNATWNGTEFSGNNNNKVVEWYDPLHTCWRMEIFKSYQQPTEEEMVTDLSTGKIFGWKSLLGLATLGWQSMESKQTNGWTYQVPYFIVQVMEIFYQEMQQIQLSQKWDLV